MFPSNRYATTLISNTIPLAIQLFMWHCVDTLPLKADYLQIFELSACGNIQKIIHSQEIPRYRTEYQIISSKPINAKIYIINDDTHATMLFSEEY